MEETIFMKIIRREIPAEIVYEDEDTLAFLDVKPVAPGHTLVVPKRPFRNILDVDNESLAAVMRTVQKVTKAVKEAVGAEGITVTMNNEPAAGQVVFHYHVHIIPRFGNDGFHLWSGRAYPNAAAAADIAANIREKLV